MNKKSGMMLHFMKFKMMPHYEPALKNQDVETLPPPLLPLRDGFLLEAELAFLTLSNLLCIFP